MDGVVSGLGDQPGGVSLSMSLETLCVTLSIRSCECREFRSSVLSFVFNPT